jgi:hypothetical protein
MDGVVLLVQSMAAALPAAAAAAALAAAVNRCCLVKVWALALRWLAPAAVALACLFCAALWTVPLLL